MEEPELIADYACVTGEGPLWHPDENRLYWLDIPEGRMFRFDPAAGAHEQVYQGEPVGGYTIQADGALLLFGARGAVRVWRNGEISAAVIEEIEGERDGRFNDVIADPAGGVFCGTMATDAHASRFYRLGTEGTLTTLKEDLGLSNGMGFTPDRRRMYHTDTRKRRINIYDYDEATGELSNERIFVSTPEEPSEGRPDGMTVDAEGYVWSARWDGSCLVRYAPDGNEERRITFPARKVSSATFGGPDYADMYVTTAGGNNKAENGPGAGALFRLRPGVRGLPPFRSRVGL